MLLKRNTVDGEIQIRDSQNIVAIIPLTGNEEWNSQVASQFADLICEIPSLLDAVDWVLDNDTMPMMNLRSVMTELRTKWKQKSD